MKRILREILSESETALLDRIRERTVSVYGLTLHDGEERVGASPPCGEGEVFYLYWISAHGGRVLFDARKCFFRDRRHNITRIPLLPENEELIYKAMDCIYQSYRSVLTQEEGAERYAAITTQAEQALLEKAEAYLDEAFSAARAHIEKHGDFTLSQGELSARSATILARLQIETAYALISYGVKALSRTKGCGRKTLYALGKYLYRCIAREEGGPSLPFNAIASDTIPSRLALLEEKMLLAPLPDEWEAEDTLAYTTALESFDRILTDTVTLIASRQKKFAEYAEILLRYTETDETTLADVAAEHMLSRERIRQICTKTQKRLCGAHRRLSDKDAAVRESDERLADVLEPFVPHDFLPLFCEDTGWVSKKRKELFLALFFSNEFREMLKEGALRKRRIKASAEPRDGFFALAVFPSEARAINTPLPESTGTCVSQIAKNVKRRIENLTPRARFIERPDTVFGRNGASVMQPDFLLLQEDGARILVLTADTLGMALYSNVKRFNALHAYCREHGLGYIILDDRRNTVYDLKRRPLDAGAEEALDAVLEASGTIFWSDVKNLKRSFAIDNRMLAAYVLQKKLHLSLRPFFIRKRK